MKTRIDLDNELREVLGSSNCYFQPPSNIKLHYPCIIYSLSSIDTKKADNKNYLTYNRYDVQVIDKNPDTELPRKILEHFQMISMGKVFVVNNLNHYNFNLYY